MTCPYQRRSLHPAHSKRGFTFIEVIAIIVVLGLVGTLVIGGFQYVTRSNLRKTSRELSNSITYYHHLAIARNLLLRMTLRFEKPGGTKNDSYFLEIGTPIRLIPSFEEIKADDPNKKDEAKASEDRNKGGKKDDELSFDERKRREQAEELAEKGDLQAGLSLRYTFSKAGDILQTEHQLPSGLRFRGVKTPHDEKMVTGDTAFIFFFPTGMVERSYIYIEQEGTTNVRTIVTQPFTGKAFIFNNYIDWEDEDAVKETL